MLKLYQVETKLTPWLIFEFAHNISFYPDELIISELSHVLTHDINKAEKQSINDEKLHDALIG